MAELPPLPLGGPVVGTRTPGSPYRPTLKGPGAPTQRSRLQPAFDRLTTTFEAQRLSVTDDAAALEPEQVLVLEVAGELTDFIRAVQKIEGFEFLAEQLEEKIESTEEFQVVDKDDRATKFDRQLFLVASDQRAWREMLSLWGRFQAGEKMPHGLTKFRDLFGRLRELRPWDDRDRLERTGVLEVWERELASIPDDEPVAFEIELWMRREQARREEAVGRLRADLETVGGELVQSRLITEIGYHGVLGRAPASRLREILGGHEVRWMRTEGVRFFHAVGQIAAPASDGAEEEELDLPDLSSPSGPPRVALLDGVPVANHELLRDRIALDDPDGWEGTTTVARRVHGTSMASLVIHGDLALGGRPLSSPVYMRPVLTTDAPEWVAGAREELPRDRLPVDLINAAVARLFEGDAPAAPETSVIVLAVGDQAQVFNRFVSPMARLLDWLSFRYGVLFLVAAGNHLDPLEIPADTGLDDPQELQHEILCAIQATSAMRRLLSPAESINALTIGAAHSDGSQGMAGDLLDPIVTPDLPSPVSALGSGIRRAVKPDVLLPGGRQLVRLEPVQGEGRLVTMPATSRPPGARAAAPGGAGELDGIGHVNGTSVAAALAGHRAGEFLDRLAAIRNEVDDFPAVEFDPLLLKAALVHGASWGSANGFLLDVQDQLGLKRSRDAVARFVGYGQIAEQEPLICDEHRVTVVAAGAIAEDAAHSYRFPLPASLSSQTARRRVTVTLVWLTPINPFHNGYRSAALTLEPGGLANSGDLLGDRTNVDKYGARRGTVQHDVHVGERAVPFAPGSALELVVGCRASAGVLGQSVPYAALVTIEIPQELGFPIYQEVRQALRPQVQTPRPRAS